MLSVRLRLVILGLCVGAVFAVSGAALPRSPEGLRAAVDGAGALAPLVALVAWVLLTPALVSGTLLAAATGLAFGAAIGTPIAVAGAALGGVVAFTVARRGGGDQVNRLGGPRLQRLQHRLEHQGFTAVLCARLAPGVPATLLNYAAGLSRVRLRDFALANALGGVPRVFAYTALGGAAADRSGALAATAVAVLVVMAVAGLALAWRTARAPVPPMAAAR